MTPRAAVATSDPRATEVATDILHRGGNGVDAAVAACLVLLVVEPHTCGVGGDAFLVLSHEGVLHALDGSGDVPLGLTTDALAGDGLEAVPAHGTRSSTVPGAVALLHDALRRHGSISMEDASRSAIALARDGFEVRAGLSEAIVRARESLEADPVLGDLYVPGGRPAVAGDVVGNPALADFLASLSAAGADGFYQGELGRRMVAETQERGGYLTAEDLAQHRTRDVRPESTTFLGHQVWEFPHPTQGPAVLHALARLDADLGPGAEVSWPRVVEAVRAGMHATGFVPAARFATPSAARGDTTYLAVVDGAGTAVSLITSVFGEFGSRVGLPVLGGPLHNRAAMFLMLGRDPSPGRPPHTTIPAMVTDDEGRFHTALGVAGGLVQPQVQVQLLISLLHRSQAPQDAVDSPRFKITFADELSLEPGHPLADAEPEAVGRPGAPRGFGAAQVVGLHHGVLAAGADLRRDGVAAVLD